MNPIGGYFELADRGRGVFPHREGILLNTGRNALEFILRSIGRISRVYIPYYTCEVVFEPLIKLSIPWSFYSINLDFEMTDQIELDVDEYLIVNNYFGIKDAYIRNLFSVYKDRLIVDCAQAFFAEQIPGARQFYSCRKFLGVADGGVAYTCDGFVAIDYPEDNTSDHDSHLYTRKEQGAEAGFMEFQNNEKKLNWHPIRSISRKTKDILDNIDYHSIVLRRRANWRFLHDRLKYRNHLQLPGLDSFKCPMVYPFLIECGDGLRKTMISNKVFVAKYWPNVTSVDGFVTEYMLTEKIVPIPIDQRYSEIEMKRVLEIIDSVI